MYPKLAILICTIPERKVMLDALVEFLQKQATDEVEIFVNGNTSSTVTIGDKRNALLDQAEATGAEYMCFVDDDDELSADYIPEILRATENRPDVIGFNADKYVAGEFHSRYSMSLIAPVQEGMTKSVPMHINPVLLEHALATRFKSLNRGEDLMYAGRLFRLLKKETYINRVLYQYNFDPSKEEKTNASVLTNH